MFSKANSFQILKLGHTYCPVAAISRKKRVFFVTLLLQSSMKSISSVPSQMAEQDQTTMLEVKSGPVFSAYFVKEFFLLGFLCA